MRAHVETALARPAPSDQRIRNRWSRALDPELRSAATQSIGASYRFGDVILKLTSSYLQLLADFESAYGDCTIDPESIISFQSLFCSVNEIPGTSIVELHFAGPGLPSLFDAALSLVRPRADLQHYTEQACGIAGWRMIANGADRDAPLLLAASNEVLIDATQEPAEFLLNLIVGIAQLMNRSTIFVHGGAVEIGGRGVLLTGPSGTGKSTTSAALAGLGHRLLGDETVGLKLDTAEIVAFRRTMKLRPGPKPKFVERRLNSVSYGSRIDANGTVCAWVKPGMLFPDATPLQSVPLKEVFFLGKFGAHTKIERFVPSLGSLDELRALTMSLSAVVSWSQSPSRRLMRFARLIELFSTCRCYRLDPGSPDATAAAIEEAVRNP